MKVFRKQLPGCLMLACLIGILSAYSYSVFRKIKSDKLLIEAIRSEDPHAVKLALNQGANPSTLCLLIEKDAKNPSGYSLFAFIKEVFGKKQRDPKKDISALMLATTRENEAVFEELLKHHPDINYHEHEGWTALTLAAQYGYPERILRLLEEGANPNAASIQGFTALFYAASDTNPRVLLRLLDKGADPNIVGANRTALIKAVVSNCTKNLSLLLRKGADPNWQDRDGRTALMHAVHNGNMDAVRLLLNNGADVSLRMTNGLDALSLCTMFERVEIKKLLEQKRLTVDR
jgi:ankyrin repeat protein